MYLLYGCLIVGFLMAAYAIYRVMWARAVAKRQRKTMEIILNKLYVQEQNREEVSNIELYILQIGSVSVAAHAISVLFDMNPYELYSEEMMDLIREYLTD